MPPKRPAKVKSSIAKLRGVDRERALHAEYLIEDHEYARESADLLAYVSFPLDDDVPAGKAFAADLASLSMDVAAFAESSTPGAAVHAAVMAVHAFRASAESHGEDYYVRKLDRLLVTLPSIEARFGD
jgi:hypothetical protein